MRFTKMHGTGNDFVVLDGTRFAADWAALAVPMNDRHFGVGGDGLIVALPSESADLRMRMFNPDGSEAEMCGNGIRCLAKFAVENGLLRPAENCVTVETGAGVLRCTLLPSAEHVERVRVSMGEPRLDPRDIPVLAEQAPPVRDFPLELDGRSFAVT